MTTTDLRDLMTTTPTANEVACGCFDANGRFYPCATCRAEVDAELATLYADAGERWCTEPDLR